MSTDCSQGRAIIAGLNRHAHLASAADLNCLGRCSFRASTPAGGGLRPLRDPRAAEAEAEEDA